MDGLRFTCQPGCTKCCEVSGFVYLTEQDITQAARHLGLSKRAFEQRIGRMNVKMDERCLRHGGLNDSGKLLSGLNGDRQIALVDYSSSTTLPSRKVTRRVMRRASSRLGVAIIAASLVAVTSLERVSNT